MLTGAKFDSKNKYRLSLYRIWDDKLPKAFFIMYNPSIADKKNNDPTITRVINYSKLWGFGGLYVGNIFCNISTKPKTNFTESIQIKKEKIKYFKKMYSKSNLTIFAWGNNQKTPKWIKKIVKNPHYIKLSKKGIPMHPLYLKKNLYPKSQLV